MSEPAPIRCYPFFLGLKATARYWDTDAKGVNERFLSDIDPEYFLEIASCLMVKYKQDASPRAALGMRHMYHHSLECMFSMACALVQANNYPIGWIMSYTNGQLRDTVDAISRGRPVPVRFRGLDEPRWSGLLKAIFRRIGPSVPEIQPSALEENASTIGTLARDLVSEVYADEYNSIKHGLRLRSGGFTFRMGLEEEPGKPAPEEAMQTVAHSDTGTSYYKRIPFEIKGDHMISSRALNWDVETVLYRLHFASVWMANFRALLLMGVCDPKEVKLRLVDKEWCEACRRTPGVDNVNMTNGYSVDDQSVGRYVDPKNPRCLWPNNGYEARPRPGRQASRHRSQRDYTLRYLIPAKASARL
jgi:hypothetical protein